MGNTGSAYKFKYGPLGNTVNLASRVQGATKRYKTPVLITAHTAACLPDTSNARRVRKVSVVNIEEPVDVYDLLLAKDSKDLKTGYEAALANYEGRQFATAVQELATLRAKYPQDTPTKLLLLNATRADVDPQTGDPVDEISK